MSAPKLLAILPKNGTTDLWVTTEWRHGHSVVVLKENDLTRAANDLRRPKPAISIRASNVPALRAALEVAEREFQQRGLLPNQGGTDGR